MQPGKIEHTDRVPHSLQLIVVMGVSGSGKSVVGQHLQQNFGCEFFDADDLHPPENVAKMAGGIPLNDADREPWLKKICERAETALQKKQSIIIACSALKARYRNVLRSVSQPVRFIFLEGSLEVIQARLAKRAGHYMPIGLLQSQFNDLENPSGEPDVVVVNIEQDLAAMLEEVGKSFQ